MKKLLLTFGALMAFNAMINAQAPRPDRTGGPAAAPQGTETKSDDAAGRGAKPGATKPAATTPTTKPTSNPDATTQGTDAKICKWYLENLPEQNLVHHLLRLSVLPLQLNQQVCDAKRRPTTPEAAPVKGTDPVK
ncbi:MAG: hypothetical protein IPI30_13170 [Saprospiraceae bacterium]|nr:hypothetical protein [Candidatus Vicinibacter affinis]